MTSRNLHWSFSSIVILSLVSGCAAEVPISGGDKNLGDQGTILLPSLEGDVLSLALTFQTELDDADLVARIRVGEEEVLSILEVGTSGELRGTARIDPCFSVATVAVTGTVTMTGGSAQPWSETFEFTRGNLIYTPPACETPTGWTCEVKHYDDDVCDCDCGAPDVVNGTACTQAMCDAA